MNIKSDFAPTVDLALRSGPSGLRTCTAALTETAGKIALLADALDRLESVSDKGSARSLRRLKAKLDDFEPTITILGQVKSGKTTLINAMAGWADLLPSDVNPLTSVVTSLHLTPGRSPRDIGANFRFMTEEEWDGLLSKGGRMGELAGRAGAETELEKLRQQIEALREKSKARLGRNFELLMGQEHRYEYFDKNLLERYICLDDDYGLGPEDHASAEQGRFADITRSAELYLNSPTLSFPMCLRDTPGVNDTFMVREQITLQAIRSSRLCIVVLSAGQALTAVDMGLIRLISNLKAREVVFFVNRIDELRSPAVQIPEIEKSIRDTLATHVGPKDVEIIFGSADWASRALTDDIEQIGATSSASLLNWAEVQLTRHGRNQSPADMVWELSGIPRLLSALSERVATRLADPLIAEVASAAVTIATGQQAAAKLGSFLGQGGQPRLADNDILRGFDRIEQATFDRLDRELADHIDEFKLQADRAHSNFVERATQALIQHLKDNGEQVTWEYDPSGLRMLLRSAYSRLAVRARNIAAERYQQAIQDIAELMYAGFGAAIEGIRIGIPDVPAAPPPIALGQTIALDFDNGWWVNWWRRRRGYDAFAEQFRSLIYAETETFVAKVKAEQVADIRSGIMSRLETEFEHYRNIISDLLDNKSIAQSAGGDRLGKGASRKQAQIEEILEALEPLAGIDGR